MCLSSVGKWTPERPSVRVAGAPTTGATATVPEREPPDRRIRPSVVAPTPPPPGPRNRTGNAESYVKFGTGPPVGPPATSALRSDIANLAHTCVADSPGTEMTSNTPGADGAAASSPRRKGVRDEEARGTGVRETMRAAVPRGEQGTIDSDVRHTSATIGVRPLSPGVLTVWESARVFGCT